MRKSLFVCVSLLFVVVSASAQQTVPSNTVSVFVSDLSLIHSSSSGTSLDAAYGAALDHRFNDHLSAELSVTSQRTRRTSTFIIAGQPAVLTYTNTLYPIDAIVSYHFFTNSRWKPYLGGGVRYVSGTVRSDAPVGSYRFSSRALNPEISGGVTFQFHPNLGLRFDAKQNVGGNDTVLGNSALSGSVGLSFRF
jgi:outer membrane autotransporter protein